MSTLQYTPPATVKEFIKHYKPGELFADWIIGPVGSGKTTGIFFKLAYLAGLQQPDNGGIRRTRCVIVRNTASQLTDTTIKSFNYWFKDGQAGKWKATVKDFILRYGDVECEVMFRPLDTPDDIDRVLSLEVTFAIVDEFVQIPKQIIEALSARCGRFPPKIEGGATNWGLFGASNPGNENDWWYAPLEDRTLLPDDEQPTNWTYFKQPSGFSKDAENLENLPGGEDYYTNLAKGKSMHWIKQFIETEWGYSLNGKPVFPMFNKEMHVAKRPLVPNRQLPIVAGFDPGMQSALTLGQYDLNGRFLVYDEIVLSDCGTERMITDYLKPLLRRKYQGFEFLIVPDPAASNRAQTNERSVVDVLKKAGFAVKVDTDNSILSRLEPAQHFMMRLTDAGPALLIDPACLRLIRALAGGYKYTVSKGEIRKDIPDKNEHSHLADAFTYLARYFKTGADKAGRRLQTAGPKQICKNSYNMR